MQSMRVSFDRFCTQFLAAARSNYPYLLFAIATLLTVFIIANSHGLEKIYALSKSDENKDLAGLLTLAVFSTVGLIFALVFRSRELSKEVSLRVQLERRADTLAHHDALTGIANRRSFAEKSEEMIAAAAKSGATVSMLVIDLDRFKPVNDLYGHAIGDKTLQVVTDRITSRLRSTDLAARTGGDEFAVLLYHDAGDDGLAEFIARRILKTISEPIWIDGKGISISSSIGIAQSPRHACTFEDLSAKADLAMQRAKKLGRDTYSCYDNDIGEIQQQRLELEAGMRDAIEAREIVPYLQPLVSLRDSSLLGFEILARWRHPTRGMIPPDSFISIAEDCGLISNLMLSNLQQACETAAQWPGDFKIAVNLSPIQIMDRELADKVKAVCDATGFPAKRLEIEITEAIFISDSDLAHVAISELKALGVSVSLDDFGTGFSSMRYLSEFPIDKVKIDRSFVMGRDDNGKNEKIVNSIISLGHSLGMLTIAEGVEKETDVEWLVAQGCDQAQGFLYSAPLALPDALSFAEAGKRDDEAALPAVPTRQLEHLSD
ncbi:MAG: putative bifunctional diguanylate cyclase/phosphodiesterase [Hyphomicrobiaceae bacterium]